MYPLHCHSLLQQQSSNTHLYIGVRIIRGASTGVTRIHFPGFPGAFLDLSCTAILHTQETVLKHHGCSKLQAYKRCMTVNQRQHGTSMLDKMPQQIRLYTKLDAGMQTADLSVLACYQSVYLQLAAYLVMKRLKRKLSKASGDRTVCFGEELD